MRRAGKYRHRVTLLAYTTARDPLGGDTKAWTPWQESVPAEVVPLSGREFIAAGADRAELSARIEVPYLPGVDETMRVRHDGKVYEIKAVLPDETARRHLTLMVSSVLINGV